jgi:hypothetical protein
MEQLPQGARQAARCRGAHKADQQLQAERIVMRTRPAEQLSAAAAGSR